MTHPENIPDTASEGEAGHIDDHNALGVAVGNIDERLHAAEIALPGKAASGHTHPGVYDPAGSAATAQAAAVQRANHSGTQAAATISDFNTAVRTNRLDQMAAPTTAVGMGSQRITGLGTPTDSTDAATKAYVDSLPGGSSQAWINMDDYGVADGKVSWGMNCSAASTTVTDAYTPGQWSAGDVGKTIILSPADGSTASVTRTITGFTSPSQITISSAPGFTAAEVGFATWGGTDNYAAVMSAVADANGKPVYFGPGTWMVDQSLVLPADARLIGAGAGSWNRQSVSNDAQPSVIALRRGVYDNLIRNVNQNTGSTAGDSGMVLRDLCLVGSTEPGTAKHAVSWRGSGNPGTQLQLTKNNRLIDCNVIGAAGSCLYMELGQESWVENSTFLFSSSHAVVVDESFDNFIHKNQIMSDWRSAYGLDGMHLVNTPASNIITDNTFYLSRSGLVLDSGAQKNIISGNRFNTHRQYGIRALAGSFGNLIQNNMAYDNVTASAQELGSNFFRNNLWAGSFVASGV